MGLYRYVANRSPADQTSRLKTHLGVLVLGGAPLEVSESDVQRLASRYVLEAVAPQDVVIADVRPLDAQVEDVTGHHDVADVTVSPVSEALTTPPSTPSAPEPTPNPPAQG